MNRIARDLLFMGIGMVIGGIGSYFILQKRYEVEIEEETSEMRDFARMQIAKYKQEKEIAEDYAKKLEAAVVEEEEVINPVEEEPEDDRDYGYPTDDRTAGIYLISQTEFDEEHPEYSKINLINYALDGTVTTDDDEILDDPRSAVGDALEEMNSRGAWKTCYVRNDRTSCDYEINNFLATYPHESI